MMKISWKENLLNHEVLNMVQTDKDHFEEINLKIFFFYWIHNNLFLNVLKGKIRRNDQDEAFS